jgi:cytosine/adenosine deaminase-related metal-dependent hydrolase
MVLANANLADGTRVDVRIAGGRISAVQPANGATPVDTCRLDLDGALLLPGLVDGHLHLDKTLLGLPFQPHLPGDSVAQRIAAEKTLRRDLPLSVEERAGKLVRQIAAYGTTSIRSHVDIDTEVGLAGLHALLRLRDRVRHLLQIQIVAFPQSGVISHPGAANLLDQAIRDGADLVGGLDPAGIDGDVTGQLDAIFAIAERHSVGVDVHLHDPGSLGCFELRQISERTIAAGLERRVAVSHAFALGEADEREFERTAETLARAGVAIMTSAPGPVAMPPVKRLCAAGVIVFGGSDNIRDAWSPYGNGDMLERATLIAYRQGFLADEDLALAFNLVTEAPASVLGLDDYTLKEGAWADLVAVPVASVPEAVVEHPPRLLVMKRGRIIARNGKLLDTV